MDAAPGDRQRAADLAYPLGRKLGWGKVRVAIWIEDRLQNLPRYLRARATPVGRLWGDRPWELRLRAAEAELPEGPEGPAPLTEVALFHMRLL